MISRPMQKYIRNNLRARSIFYLEHFSCKCVNLFKVNRGYSRNLFYALSSCFIISKGDNFVHILRNVACFCKHDDHGFGWCQIFLCFSHILFNFWIREQFFVVFGFEKLVNMLFVKSVFAFLTDFILSAQIMICPKSLYRSHNQPEILKYPW